MSTSKIKNVAVVGGTHGNELTGIHIVRELLAQPKQEFNFELKLLLANLDAIKVNRRYVEKDLNRCFTTELLEGDGAPLLEIARAKEINTILGPKGNDEACDLILDLHNSTANMGICLIVSQFEDPLILAMCSHLVRFDPWVRIYYQPEDARINNPYLPSVGKRDICIEVGPQAHGTLRPELYQRTKAIVQECLEFVDDWNAGTRPDIEPFKYFKHLDNIDFPRDEDGQISATIHPNLEFKDYQVVEPGDPIFLSLDGVTKVWNGDKPVWPLFINEAAYYEKKLAFSLTTLESYTP